MSFAGENILLRAYLHSADRFPRLPTHQRLVKAARAAKLAGATVLQGIAGTGYHSASKKGIWSILDRSPIIVEIVDSPEKIAAFVEHQLREIMTDGVVTLERAAIMMYRHRKTENPPTLRLADMLQPLSTVPHIGTESDSTMEIQENGILLRVFIGESDRSGGQPLYEVILQKTRELGLAGATVLRGIEGFGANSIVHKAALLEMSTDLPLVIEIMDQQEKIELLLPHLQTLVQEGLITMEHVRILLYRHNPADAK
jgi:uncharacterized protein